MLKLPQPLLSVCVKLHIRPNVDNPLKLNALLFGKLPGEGGTNLPNTWLSFAIPSVT